MAGRCFPRPPVVRLVYFIHTCTVPVSAAPGAGVTQGRAEYSLEGEAQDAPGRDTSCSHYFYEVGTVLFGVTSLVESAAVGALITTIAALTNKRLTWKGFIELLRGTLSVSCMFMWVILAALAFGTIFDGLGAVHAIKGLFLEYGFGPWGIILMMQLSYLAMGTFLDDTAMLIIVAPLYVPLVIELGFDPIWYGVLYTITCQIAYLTPPFGYNQFLMKAMAPKEITLGDIYRSIIPFVGIMIVGLIIVMLFPKIALWLPSLYYLK